MINAGGAAEFEGVGHAEAEVVGAPRGPDDLGFAQQSGGLGDDD